MRFEGEIAGMGSTSGVRLVVGLWQDTPYGTFADVMVQQADDHRVLLAPTDQVAEFIASTYTFDETVLGPVEVAVDGPHRRILAPGLELEFTVGARSGLGRLLRLVPRRVATAPPWLVVIDPVARVVLRGVRTQGSARTGRREYYGAYDVHRVVNVRGTWRGADLGRLAPVDPPVTVGFGSTPRTPAITRLVTTVTEPGLRRRGPARRTRRA